MYYTKSNYHQHCRFHCPRDDAIYNKYITLTLNIYYAKGIDLTYIAISVSFDFDARTGAIDGVEILF